MKRQVNLLIYLLILVSLIPQWAYGERTLPRLIDDAYILSNDQVANLTDKLDSISERQNFDVIIVTVDTLEGDSSVNFADDVYDYNGFGMGPNSDGILLLLAMEEREWAISTRGYGINAFTDEGQKYITDSFMKYLSRGDYYKGFEIFADMADDFVTQAKSGSPYDSGNLPKKAMSPIWILISVLGGMIVAFIVTGTMKSSLKSVSKQRVATKYLVDTSMLPFSNQDLFLYSTVSRTERIKENENTRKGSSTHTSSSGNTHGGSSGKF